MSEPLDPGEREAIAALIAGHGDEAALREQLATARVLRRKSTGAGVRVALVVDHALPTAADDGAAVTGASSVECRIGGIAASALLWLDDGRLHELEICVADGTAPRSRTITAVRAVG